MFGLREDEMQAIFETIFDLVYLVGISIIGIQMISKSKKDSQFFLFGVMALVLAFGDSFHLIPRMIGLNTTGLEDFTFYLGLGEFITSITMTIFYVILYHVWKKRYKISKVKNLDFLVYILSIVRIVLCLIPANDWFNGNGPLSWRIYRNIPFSLLGILIIYLFYKMERAKNDENFKNMYLTIILSFAFYLPVVIFEDSYSLVGALMVPKTCAYVWSILIGYFAMKKEENNEKVY